MKNQTTSSAAAPGRARSVIVRAVVAMLALSLAMVTEQAMSAQSIRFLRRDVGQRADTATDDYLAATRVFWDDAQQPVQVYLYRRAFAPGQDIIPLANNTNGLSNLQITQAIAEALRTWNDVSSGFSFREGVIYSDFAPINNPLKPFGPDTVALDRINPPTTGPLLAPQSCFISIKMLT